MSQQANALAAEQERVAQEKRVADAKLAEEKAAADAKLPPRKSVMPVRARFIVTEITHTTRGTTVLTLAATHDGDIPAKDRLVPGNNPKGEISIEVADVYALTNVSHGSVYYLISA